MFRAPRKAQLPHLLSMLDNIASNDAEIAKFLEITPQTLRKYRQKGQAPRLVMLALFWETSWGRSAADCNADNYAKLQYMRAMMLERKVVELETTVAQLHAQLDQNTGGAANSPVFAAR